MRKVSGSKPYGVQDKRKTKKAQEAWVIWRRKRGGIKGSLSSSWMNSPIPSLLLPLWQKESLCETIGMKIYVTCTFISIKIKSFSCETFSTSTRSEKEANGNSEVKVKSAYVPSGPLGQRLFQFLDGMLVHRRATPKH